VTDDDLKLLREIVGAGGKKYTSGNIDRAGSNFKSRIERF
jgi:hypothetical protein